MATVQPQTIHAIAESVAVGRLSDDAAKALAPHVDVRLREIVQARAVCKGTRLIPCYDLLADYVRHSQDAAKLMRHAKRGVLTTEDVNNTLRLRNVQVFALLCLCVCFRLHMT